MKYKNRLSKTTGLAFVILTSFIFEATYTLYTTTGNIVQSYIITHHFSDAKFPALNILASRVLMLFMLLCLLEPFQRIKYQRVLMCVALGLLIIIPLSLQTYPLISGLSSVVYNLTEPWRQLFVPPAIRTTVEGLTEALTSFEDIASIFVENDWISVTHDYLYIVSWISIFLILFWWFTRHLPHLHFTKKVEKHQKTTLLIKTLFIKYPYVFIASFLAGVNEAIFSYSALIAHEVLPTSPGKTYQNVMYVSSFLVPILISPWADRCGIYLVLILTSVGILCMKLINVALIYAHVTTLMPYYIDVFFEAGFCASLWMLDASLIGERLRYVGVFRSFALSNIVFSLGVRVTSRVYEWFSYSFVTIQLIMCAICIICLGFLIWYYRQDKLTPAD